MTTASYIAPLAARFGTTEAPATDGIIALLNLEAQIDGQQSEAMLDYPTVDAQVALIELITLRGLILGRIVDYECAEALAERLARSEAANGAAFVARARIRATLHLFADALNDLDVAELLSPNVETINTERAAIFQGLGRYDEALAIRQGAADRRPSFETLGALAGLCAELGEIEAAERLYLEGRSRYRGVSPFPLALLDFQCGLMWMNNGRLDDARTSFDAARRRVPTYAPAQGHLAEVEAEFGDIETAVARLYPLAISSDDPDYTAQLARILGNAGRTDESRHWCQQAAARYDELVVRHPEAFADHAAEFWLAAGTDPNKALRLARINLEVRKTPRAYNLFSQAVRSSQASRFAIGQQEKHT
jgi:tetratricopeptide (TPR) repeat protein